MNTFVTLTQLDGSQLVLNVEHIVSFERDNVGTKLFIWGYGNRTITTAFEDVQKAINFVT